MMRLCVHGVLVSLLLAALLVHVRGEDEDVLHGQLLLTPSANSTCVAEDNHFLGYFCSLHGAVSCADFDALGYQAKLPTGIAMPISFPAESNAAEDLAHTLDTLNISQLGSLWLFPYRASFTSSTLENLGSFTSFFAMLRIELNNLGFNDLTIGVISHSSGLQAVFGPNNVSAACDNCPLWWDAIYDDYIPAVPHSFSSFTPFNGFNESHLHLITDEFDDCTGAAIDSVLVRGLSTESVSLAKEDEEPPSSAASVLITLAVLLGSLSSGAAAVLGCYCIRKQWSTGSPGYDVFDEGKKDEAIELDDVAGGHSDAEYGSD